MKPTIFSEARSTLVKHFYHRTVYNKLVFLTLSCSLFPLLIASIISYSLNYNISKEHTVDSIYATNRQIALNITNRLEQIEHLADSISYQLYSLYTTPLEPLSNYLSTYSSSKNNIASIKNTFSIFQVTVFLPENNFTGSSGNGIDFFPIEKINNYNMTAEELYDSGSACFWRLNKNQQFPQAFSARPKSVLTYWSSYRNVVTEHLNYAFACHIEISEFHDLLLFSLDSDFGQSFLINRDNVILLCSDPAMLGTSFDVQAPVFWEKQTYSYTQGNSLFVSQLVKNGDMILITQVPLSYIRQNSNFTLTFALITTVLIVLCAIGLSVFISKTFTHRIHLLAKAMKLKEFHNPQKAQILLAPMIRQKENKKDEIDRLAVTYQTMLKENEEYFQKILDMNLNTEKLRYQLLQSQINPHFLFNTLNAIMSCQAIGKAALAQQMTLNLSQFYRNILHDPDTMISIQEELRITELYLSLISLCKSNCITWEFLLDEGTENFLICKFIFQPFVENSVLHGISDSTVHLHIRIKIKYEDDLLLISIEDNGSGIPQEKLYEIQKDLKNNTVNYNHHFGISNVNMRLAPYFSPQYPFIQVESNPGLSTRFTFHIQQFI